MKNAIVFLALSAASAFAALTINTPANVVQCEPTQLNWSGGTGPYFLSILPGASPNGAALESFPATNATSYTWTVDLAANTAIGFTLRDSTGTIAQSAPVTISPGSTTSCSNASSVAGGSTTPGASTPVNTGTSTTSTLSGNTVGTNTPSTPTSSSSKPSSTSSSSGASTNIAQLSAAGLAGVAIAALFL